MRMYDLIMKKRNGGALEDSEIEFIIKGVTDGSVPDYQLSAFLMAVYFNGMNERETLTLTKAMAQSGDCVDLSSLGDATADKHSTGGVGDKTTLIVAPIAAACGAVIAKMSGRGLGHTGGTVDKLEAIRGFKTELPPEEFMAIVKKTGLAVIGQSGNLAPADKKLYALRDITATVENPSMIAASIMSKKLAAGAKNIVLDVKCGKGAFMKNQDDAVYLANEMVKIGAGAGRNVCAVISDMNVPLGKAIGNALEVKEAVEILRGSEDGGELREVCLTLAAQMVAMALNKSDDEAKEMAENALSSGKAYEKFKQMVAAQGGNVKVIEDTSLLPGAQYSCGIMCSKSGFVTGIDALSIGSACVALGAGRSKKDDVIDFGAGIILNKNIGDSVNEGEALATLYSNTDDFTSASALVKSAFETGEKKPEKRTLIYSIIKSR